MNIKLKNNDESVFDDYLAVKKTFNLLGLFKEKAEEFLEKVKESDELVPEAVINLAEQRLLARQNKNWAESDKLRDEIKNLGFEILDEKDGFKLKKI